MNDSEDTPWLDDKRWRDNKIRSGARMQLWGKGLGALVFSGIGVFLVVSFLPRLLAGKEEAAGWLVMLFPVIGVVVTALFVRDLLAWRRIGPVELQLDPFPGSVDGQLGGTFWIDTSVDEETPFEVGLECLYRHTERRNNKSVRSTRSVWHATGPGMLVTTGTSAAVQFRFDVPGGLPLSEDHLGESDFHTWRVSLKGHAADIKLDRHYTVPVFATARRSSIASSSDAARSQRQAGSLETLVAHLENGDYDQTPLAQHATFEQLRNVLEIRQGVFRNKVIGAFALMFAVVPGIIAWQFLAQPIGGAFGAIFSLSGLIPAAISLLASVAVVYLLFNSLTTRIDRNGIFSIRRVLGIKARQRQLASDAITELTLHRSGSTGSGTRRIEHLDVRAMTADGNHVTLIEGIDNRPPAEALKAHLGGLLGLG